MLGEPTTFWAKIERAAGDTTPRWHPLVCHSADVAAVVEALLRLPVWRRRLGALAGRELTEADVARLSLFAALHDLGKFNIGFQAKGRPGLGQQTGHVAQGLAAACHGVFPFLNELASWGEAVWGLLVAALSHHGKPHTLAAADADYQSTWWLPRVGLDPRKGAAELFERCRAWFPLAFDAAGALPEPDPFSHAFAGLVMLADWLGSDTKFFPFAEDVEGDRITAARRRAADALRSIGLDYPVDLRRDGRGRDAFARVAREGCVPRPAQSAMLSVPVHPGGSIVVLESETGSGKTEAALAWFVVLFERGEVDGMYFALPTRSAATQMHARILKAARQSFVDPPPVVLAVPGYVRVDDADGARGTLPRFEVQWPDNGRFRYRGWAAENAKRYLAGSIVVGTIDQVLLASLTVPHAHLRSAALFRHLLVVDEVHASDAYMGRVLEDVLARHRAAGGHALLLSATLGSEARSRFLCPGQPIELSSLTQAEAAPYPLISTNTDKLEATCIVRDDRIRAIAVTPQPWLGDPSQLAAQVLMAAVSGAKVLVIRNTVADCVATQEAVEHEAAAAGRADVLFTCAGVAAPHHSRFARADREALDRALESRLGATRAAGGCVVVATQTVQQSLDIDADILFTDICPADVLLQRFGRLHRHARTRPAGFEAPRALVLVPADRDLGALLSDRGTASNHHGLGSVYPDLRIVEATWRLIEAHREWVIPDMNRHLVERSVHREVLAEVVEQGGARWRRHDMEMAGAARGQRRLAELNLVEWSQPYGQVAFPPSGDERIATRLGEGDRRARFERPFNGPFGLAVAELTIRPWWVKEPADGDALPSRVAGEAGVTRFSFVGNRFVYDRLGLRPEAIGGKEAAEEDGP